MADSFDQFETLLREQIESRVHDLVLPEDDVLWTLMNTWEGVTVGGRTTDGAAGYEASWRVRIQRAGRVAARTFVGNTLIQTGPTGAKLNAGQDADAKYLDPAFASLRSYLKIVMLLKRIVGGITLNKQQVLADMATDPIEDLSTDYAEDAIFRLRKLITAWGWGDGSAMIAQVNASGGYTISEGSQTAVTIDVGTPFRFTKGDKLVAGSVVTVANYGSSARTARAGASGQFGGGGVMVVTDIDIENRTIDLESLPGEGDVSLSDNDALMHWETYDFTQSTVTAGSLACHGIESLIVNTGNFPGTSIAVGDVTELKGIVQGDETALDSPEPEKIAKLIDIITDAGLQPPPVLVSEQSVKTLYAQLERQGQSIVNIPQGTAFQANGGVSGARFQHGDHAMAWLVSSQIRPGMVAGLSPDTFRRFMPLGDRTIKWAINQGGLASVPGIFRAVTDGRQLTEMMDAPFESAIQFGQTNPRRNFRRVGFLSQRTA